VTLAVPGPLDQRTGGYIYDRRMVDGLRARGWPVAVARLDESFPHPTPAALEEADRVLAAVSPGAMLLIDSLALGAMPDVVERAARRVPVVALVHLPLASDDLRGQTLSPVARAERRALEAAALIVMTGDATRRILAPYGLPPARLVVVEPGTDRPEDAEPSGPAGASSGTSGAVELLCVATLNALKGHEVLLAALASLRSGKWHLTCAGSLTRDRDTAEGVQKVIAQLGLEPQVTLAGELDERSLEACFRRADVFVLATRQETYGMAVAEAIAHGIPVVATDTGAIAAIVGAEAGLIVPVGDQAALAAALGRLVGDASLRASLAAGARRARRRLPTWDDAVDRFAAALEPLTHG
jgi:glycosyltransferase involved in cell wall biosynthesis